MDPKRRRKWWLALVALAIGAGFVAQVVWWVGDGCPVWGYSVGVGSSITGRRSIVASSNNLLVAPGLSAGKQRATIRLGQREIVVEGDSAIVDRSTTYAIPPGTDKVEITLKGKVLRLLGDGRDLGQAAPPR